MKFNKYVDINDLKLTDKVTIIDLNDYFGSGEHDAQEFTVKQFIKEFADDDGTAEDALENVQCSCGDGDSNKSVVTISGGKICVVVLP